MLGPVGRGLGGGSGMGTQGSAAGAGEAGARIYMCPCTLGWASPSHCPRAASAAPAQQRRSHAAPSPHRRGWEHREGLQVTPGGRAGAQWVPPCQLGGKARGEEREKRAGRLQRCVGK